MPTHMLRTTLLCLSLSVSLLASTPLWQLDSADQGWSEEVLAQTYFHHSELQRQWAWELLASYPFTGSERVLDFGCGDGKLSAEISHFVAQGAVAGVDLSASMVSFANRCFPKTLYPNLSFAKTEDVEGNVSGVEGNFDLICSFCVFHMLPDPTTVLRNLRGHLSESGRLLAVFPTGKWPALFQAVAETFHAYDMLAPWERSSGSRSGPSIRSLEGTAEILANAGWASETLREVHTRTAFYSRQELIDWLLGTCIANWGVPQEIAEPFFAQVVDRTAELDPDLVQSDGSYHVRISRIHLIAYPTA